jgi:hypothetical protein
MSSEQRPTNASASDRALRFGRCEEKRPVDRSRGTHYGHDRHRIDQELRLDSLVVRDLRFDKGRFFSVVSAPTPSMY